MPAPGLRGFRTAREDIRQEEQHDAQMQKAQMSIQQMAREQEEWEEHSALREKKRKANKSKMELKHLQNNYQIENFDRIQGEAQLDAQLERESNMLKNQRKQQKYQQEEQDRIREFDSFIAERIPEDISDMTDRQLKRLRRDATHMGFDPDEMGIPEQLNAGGARTLRQRRNLAVNNVEQQQETEQMRLEEEMSAAEDRLVRYADELDEVERKLEISPDDPQLLRRKRFLEKGMERETAITGRTPEDVAPSMRDKLAEEYHTAQYMEEDIERAIGLLEEDMTRAGVPGAIQNIMQQSRDIATTVPEMFNNPAGQWVTDQVVTHTSGQAHEDTIRYADEPERDFDYAEWFDPALSELRQFENAMAYRLARMRWGPGRINMDTVNRARNEIGITGIRSPQDAMARLRSVSSEIRRKQKGLEVRLEGRVGEGDDLYRYTMTDEEERVIEEESEDVLIEEQMEERFGVGIKSKDQFEDPDTGKGLLELESGHLVSREGQIKFDPNLPDALQEKHGADAVQRDSQGNPIFQNDRKEGKVYLLSDGTVVNKKGEKVGRARGN